MIITNCRVDGWGALLDVDEHQKQLLRPVRYRWEDENGLQEHTATQGYIFDGASKWFAWRLIGYPWGKSAKAACLHDRCFSERFRLSNGERVTFDYAADLYKAFLLATGVHPIQTEIEYLAVLTPFARRLWHSHDQEFMDASR